MRCAAWLVVLFILILAQPVFATGDDTDAIKRLLDRVRAKDAAAVPALVKHGETAVPGLMDVLKEGNPEVQPIALQALGLIGPPAKAAIPLLVEGLVESSNENIATQAALALGRIGPAAVPDLIRVLEKGVRPRAILAAKALAQAGPAAKDAEPGLLKHLKASKDPREEAIFIDALIALGPSAKAAVPALVELGKSRQKKAAQVHVVIGLGKIGPAAKDAVPYLTEIMSDAKELPHLRIHALVSLSQVAPSSKAIEDAMPELLKGGIWPRPIVIETLAHTGPISRETRAALEEAVNAKDPMTRVFAAQGLGKANPKDGAVVSVLIESLQDRNADVRRQAAVAIGEVRPADPAVRRTLEKAANDADPAVRVAATAALKKLEKK